jgi:hypothetical protein
MSCLSYIGISLEILLLQKSGSCNYNHSQAVTATSSLHTLELATSQMTWRFSKISFSTLIAPIVLQWVDQEDQRDAYCTLYTININF